MSQEGGFVFFCSYSEKLIFYVEMTDIFTRVYIYSIIIRSYFDCKREKTMKKDIDYRRKQKEMAQGQ